MAEGLKRGDWVEFIHLKKSDRGLVINEGIGKPRRVTVSWTNGNQCEYWDHDLGRVDGPVDPVIDGGVEFVVQDLSTPEMKEVTRYRAHSVEIEGGGPVVVLLDANGVPVAFHHLAPNHSVIPLTDAD